MNIGLGSRRRTILIVDADAHARALLRAELEASGFTVAEAANEREGERTALRIKPAAILVELISDHDDSILTVPERLVAQGIPCYIVSSAAQALMGSVGLHELGISGVFSKPIEPAIVVQTLETRLGVREPDKAHA